MLIYEDQDSKSIYADQHMRETGIYVTQIYQAAWAILTADMYHLSTCCELLSCVFKRTIDVRKQYNWRLNFCNPRTSNTNYPIPMWRSTVSQNLRLSQISISKFVSHNLSEPDAEIQEMNSTEMQRGSQIGAPSITTTQDGN